MSSRVPIQSTAGAVPVKTDKGFKMQKVKVTRYIAGKAPEYANEPSKSSSSSSSSDESDNEDEIALERRKRVKEERRRGTPEYQATRQDLKYVSQTVDEGSSIVDARLRRLMAKQEEPSREIEEDVEEREIRLRERHEDGDETYVKREVDNEDEGARRRIIESSDEGDDDDLSDEEIERRRVMLRLRNTALEKEEVLGRAEESGDEEEFEDEESEYEESESDEDELHRLKPVFVKKKERVTLTDGEKEQQKLREQELRKKYEVEDRKRQAVKIVEDMVKHDKELERKRIEKDDENLDLTSIITDDENEELAYETWKVRELKRLKRGKEEREQHDKEKAEISKVHNMTEDERRAYLRANPKLVTNKQQKGKYKFLQKYYHRGAFYLNEEDEVYKRNFAEATLEDHFDKTVLPKIMQVKDFGKAGRTKWSHLVGEDTTDFQSAWHADTAQNIKFHQKHGAGMKDVFERPALKKRKL